MTAKSTAARIILEDGTEYEGTAFGYAKSAAGEIVMYTGYPDFPRILTDPALKSTILIASHPMAGAAGFTREHLCPLGLETDYESASAHIAGLVVASFAPHADHWTAHKTIHLWLRKHRIPGISGIDTRALIQRVSRRGSMRAKILIEDANDISFSSAGSTILRLSPSNNLFRTEAEKNESSLSTAESETRHFAILPLLAAQLPECPGTTIILRKRSTHSVLPADRANPPNTIKPCRFSPRSCPGEYQ